MKKKILKILTSLFTVLFVFALSSPVYANEISRIEMDVYIDENGNASIKETWNAHLTQGTEGYRAFDSETKNHIRDFSVEDGTGRIYTFNDYWDVDDSFEEKAYKCGFHNTSNGIELCWGISQYGNNTYTLSYKIDNLVREYSDGQGIDFNFLNIDQYVSHAKITIHTNDILDSENCKIWGFGYDGTIQFENGNIVLETTDELSSNSYMVALVRFENNPFASLTGKIGTFDEAVERAKIGTEDEGGSDGDLAPAIAGIVIPFVITFAIVRLITNTLVTSASKENRRTLNYGKNGKRLPKSWDIDYYREIPCFGDLSLGYFLLKEYDVLSEQEANENIVGAIILKWIKENKVKVTKTKAGFFSLKEYDFALDFRENVNISDDIEDRLYRYMKAASGPDKILEAKEFQKWSKTNYSRIRGWYKSHDERAKSLLINKGLIKTEQRIQKSFIFKPKKYYVTNVDPRVKDEVIKLLGFKKFIKEFSVMEEKGYGEVHMWDEYMIFASLLGIAETANKQLEKMYPQMQEEIRQVNYTSYYVAHHLGHVAYSGSTKGYSDYVASQHRSSGGGGSSYSGGGGFSGGSSGGGFR